MKVYLDNDEISLEEEGNGKNKCKSHISRKDLLYHFYISKPITSTSILKKPIGGRRLGNEEFVILGPWSD